MLMDAITLECMQTIWQQMREAIKEMDITSSEILAKASINVNFLVSPLATSPSFIPTIITKSVVRQ